MKCYLININLDIIDKIKQRTIIVNINLTNNLLLIKLSKGGTENNKPSVNTLNCHSYPVGTCIKLKFQFECQIRSTT